MVDNPTTKEVLSNIDSTTASTYEDLKDIGDQVDYSKMTLDQLKDEFRKFRKEYADFKWQVQKLVANEIQKQVQPLADQIQELVAKDPRVVYVRFKFRVPLLDFFKKMWNKLNIWQMFHRQPLG